MIKACSVFQSTLRTSLSEALVMPGDGQDNQGQNIFLIPGHIYCHVCQMGLQYSFIPHLHPSKGDEGHREKL